MSRRIRSARAAPRYVAIGLAWLLVGGSAKVSAQDHKPVSPAPGQQLVNPQQQSSNKGAPIKITAVGNKLVITSDDPKALATASDLVRLLTQPQGGQGDFEVIRLKTASATEVAKALDEAFNGPRQQTIQPQQGGPGRGGSGGRRGSGGRDGFDGFFGDFAGAGAALPANPSPNTIRVVAYPPTNTLLVRASPIDMLRIRKLLKNAIDTEDPDSKAVMKTWILKPLQFATATEVAGVIKDVYREYTNNNPQPAQGGGFLGFGFPGGGFSNANVDADGNPRAVRLTVGVDDRANRIIVNCSESVYQDIQALVDQLDSGTQKATRTIKVVPLQGIDPLLVQQAIDAIQGRRAPSTPSRMGQGASGTSPFGRGEFTPGMIPPAATPGGGAPPS